jgi:hypothetical protein
MLLATAFFGICSLVLVGLLLDPRGVTINRSIPLGPLGADIFFDILMISSLALTWMGFRAFLRCFGPVRSFVLDHHALRGPKNALSRQEVRITLRTIEQLHIQTYRNEHFICINGGGQTMRVATSDLVSEQEFARFLGALEDQMAA